MALHLKKLLFTVKSSGYQVDYNILPPCTQPKQAVHHGMVIIDEM